MNYKTRIDNIAAQLTLLYADMDADTQLLGDAGDYVRALEDTVEAVEEALAEFHKQITAEREYLGVVEKPTMGGL